MALTGIKYMVDVDSKGAVTGIKAATDAAEQGGSKFSVLDTVLKGVQIGMGLDVWGSFKNVISGAVGALPALIGKTGEYVGELLKTNSGLRLAVEAQQVLKRAGDDAGVSWDLQTGAIRKMQNVLADAPQSVAKLGLSWDDIKKMAPEKQYEAIGKAISNIGDDTKRTQAATDFFGKSGTEVLGLFGGAIATAEADVRRFALAMSEDTARSIDRLSDNVELGGVAFEGMGRNIVGAIAASEPLQMVVEGILDAIGWLSRTVQENQTQISQWVTTGVIYALQALAGLKPVIAVTIDAFTGLYIIFASGIKWWKDMGAAAAAAFEILKNPGDAFNITKKLFADLAANQKEMVDTTNDAMRTNNEWQSKLSQGAQVLDGFIAKVVNSSGATATNTAETNRSTQAYGENTKATDAAAKAAEDLAKKLGFIAPVKADKAIKDILDTVNRLSAGLSTLTDGQLKKAVAELKNLGPAGEAAAVGLEAAARATELIQKNVVSLDGVAGPAAASVDEITVSVNDLGVSVDSVGGFQKTFNNELERGAVAGVEMDQALKDVAAAAKTQGDKTKEAADKTAEHAEALEKWADKWNNIAALIGSVGDIFETLGIRGAKTLQSISEGLSVGTDAAAKFSTVHGTLAKAMVVAETAAYALKAGVVGGAAAGAQFGATWGPLGAVIGGVGGALLGWIGKAARAREEAAKLAAEINKMRGEFIASVGGIDALQSKAAAAGYTLEKLFNAKTVADYNAAVKELNDAFDLQAKANDALTAAMDKYGISIEQLGPKFSQQRLDAMAMDLLRDYELLIAAGVDMVVVIEKMGPAFNDYVQKAIASGATLPESLRPIIAKMIELGLLTDAAGNKIENIDDIKFAPTVSEAVAEMTKAIRELINALLGIPNVDYTVTRYNRTVNEGGDPGGDPGEPPAYAAGGIVAARPGGVIARIAEAGQSELVAPVRAFSAQLAADLAQVVNGGGGSGGDVYILVDSSSGSSRQLSAAEARRIQNAMGAGMLKVPVRATVSRVS